MAAIFAGKWKLDRSEKFDDYLKELGGYSQKAILVVKFYFKTANKLLMQL